MKKLLLLVSLCLFSIVGAQEQNDVTRFLGIPVDGSKEDMISALKAKGYRSSAYDSDVLEGEFNGQDVHIFVVTNNNKVCRIMVCDANPVDVRSIQIRFNKLCRQFENNPKYLKLDDCTIPDDEDIAYEMLVHKKRYEAVFVQNTPISEKYTVEELANMPTEQLLAEIFDAPKKKVWFMISDYYGKYYITMFYDNEYNRANGEDL